MPRPDFKVGDEVEVEAEKSGEYPRYDGTIVRGGNGKWIKGKITELSERNMAVEFKTTADFPYRWEWYAMDTYPDNYWSLSGQIRLIKSIEKSPYSFKKGYFKDLLSDGYFPELEVKLLGKRKYK